MITQEKVHSEYDVMRENIKYYRKKLGYSQEKFAEICDLSTSYIKQIESENEFKNVSLTTLLKISKSLGISVHDLFEVRDEK
jgi:transcriptional regulator with XRE-family HTH domain